ncbi:hypothetical protein [Thermoleptolyngbya sp. M55_K2018_002]|uniref:hypothetical protein n=1 Tax=Thermoleptolyngbya sp. M55_K2018_002 TaxID=2747808 RepID=UPI0019F646B9|nr:hypothetical protein [Thermoleptolyngbya sp. M55_K2018_002]HIK41278.1 hypothetical protein [Thermoleptolyngbya sp. M55_K2018_002]
MSKPLFNAEESLKQSENIGSHPSQPFYNKMILVGAPDWVSRRAIALLPSFRV